MLATFHSRRNTEENTRVLIKNEMLKVVRYLLLRKYDMRCIWT
jgi:hypothetical protein